MPTNIPLLFQNVRVLDPAQQRDETADLFVNADGLIAPVPKDLPANTRRFHGPGLAVCPGLWDLHAHFREPGNTAAETLATGAAAAAAGGFTRVVTMPNTDPPCDTPALVAKQINTALPVKIFPSACVTQGRTGKRVADLEALSAAGAIAFTDDGNMVSDPAIMREALLRAKALNRVIMDHAVLPGAGVAYAGPAQNKFAWQEFYAATEVEAVRQNLALANETDGRLHFQHLSCGETLKLLSNSNTTCEVTPHHLWFSSHDIPGDDTNFKMNPPLGTPADRDALIEAVLCGKVTCLATDHAPHTAASKSKPFAEASFGVIGLETAVAATWTQLVVRHGLAPLQWVALWTLGPALVLGLPPPSLREGEPADLVLLDLEFSHTVQPEKFCSLSRNTPFAGQTLTGRVVLTRF